MIEVLHKWMKDQAVTTYTILHDDYAETREKIVLIRTSGQPLAPAEGNQTLFEDMITVIASSIIGVEAKAEGRKIIAAMKAISNLPLPTWVYGGQTYAATVIAQALPLVSDPQYIGQDENGIKFYGTYFNISYSH